MNVAIEVAIGLVFLYLLLALVVTTVQELWASWTDMRAKDLYASLEQMLQGSDADKASFQAGSKLVSKVYDHSLIKNLRQDPRSSDVGGNPSYITSRTFALVLLDVLQGEKKASEASGVAGALNDVSQAVDKLAIPSVKKALQVLIADARRTASKTDDDVAVVTTAIETWFNDRMARASGWYKRKAKVIALVLAGVVVSLANADSIHVATRLWQDATLRQTIVAKAQVYYEQSKPTDVTKASAAAAPTTKAKAVDSAIAELEAASFPLGWSKFPTTPLAFLLKLASLFVSALAVSLGSPFWFDLLGRVVQLRGTGPRVSTVTGQVEGKGA